MSTDSPDKLASIGERLDAASKDAGSGPSGGLPPSVILRTHGMHKQPEEPWSWRREWRFAICLAVFFAFIFLGPFALIYYLIKAEQNGAVDHITELFVRYLPYFGRFIGTNAEAGDDPLVSLHDEL